MELLAKLGIDWRLLIAQIVNFAILAGVLAALVYKPLLNVLDQRAERIRKAMESARKAEEQARTLEVLRQQELKKIDAECGLLLERTKKQAGELERGMLEKAKQEASRVLERGKQELAEERAKALREVQETVARVVVQLTEKLLAREFSPADQQRMLKDLSAHIPSLLR